MSNHLIQVIFFENWWVKLFKKLSLLNSLRPSGSCADSFFCFACFLVYSAVVFLCDSNCILSINWNWGMRLCMVWVEHTVLRRKGSQIRKSCFGMQFSRFSIVERRRLCVILDLKSVRHWLDFLTVLFCHHTLTLSLKVWWTKGMRLLHVTKWMEICMSHCWKHKNCD